MHNMKKNLFWMLAAILFCGSMATVLTSCGDDDDDSNGSSSTVTPSSDNTYEVTLSAVLPRCSAPYLSLHVNYTDANGKSDSFVVKEGDQTEALSSEAKTIYVKGTTLIRTSDDNVRLIDNIIVRTVTFTVPAGKTFSYTGSIVTRTDYTAPTEDVSVVQPCVICTAKRISGSGTDNSASVVNASMSVTGSFGIHAEKFADLLARWNGREVGKGLLTLQ